MREGGRERGREGGREREKSIYILTDRVNPF